MNNPPSPALRLLQVSSDGKTLVGRSPHTGKSPSAMTKLKGRDTKEDKKSHRITAYFSKGTEQFKEGDLVALSAEKDSERCVEVVKKSVDQDRFKDTSVNTDLEFGDLDDDGIVLESLYNTGPCENFWKNIAHTLRQQFNEAILEKMACDDEIEQLLDEKRKLEMEMDEYKEYFELRQTTEDNAQ